MVPADDADRLPTTEQAASRDGDGLTFEPVGQRPRRRRRLVRYAVFFGIVSVSAAAAWFIIDSGLIGGRRGDSIPIVHANKDPIKVKPDSPGGMAVPDRDKLVYDRLAPGSAPAPVEQLLPRAEAPMQPPQPKPGDTPKEGAAQQPVPALPPVMPEGVKPDTRSAPPSSPQQVETVTPKNMLPKRLSEDEKRTPPPSSPSAIETPVRKMVTGREEPAKTETQQAEPKQTESKQTEPPKTIESLLAETASRPPAKTGGEPYRVQLAAVRSSERAKQEWERIKKKNADVLGKLDLSVMRADLGAKGIYYRLRAGPLASETEARAVCSKLSARKVPCLVVRPNG
ncbi:MAG: SPOR domain-containing protein [Rhodospirillales bacterium]